MQSKHTGAILAVALGLVLVLGFAGAGVRARANRGAAPTMDAATMALDQAALNPDEAPVGLFGTAVRPEVQTDDVNWTTKLAWPLAARYRGMSCTEADSVLYCVGGQTTVRFTDCRAYRVESNAYTTIAAITNPNANQAASWWFDDTPTGDDSSGIYVMGRYDGSYYTTCYKWTKATNTWNATIAQFPSPSYSGTMQGTIGDTVYLNVRTSSTGACIVRKYNTRTDTWFGTTGAPTYPNNYYGAMCAYGGKLYQLGGWMASLSFQVYDPATDAWTAGGNPAVAGGNTPCLAGYDGKIWAWGGGNGWTAWSGCEAYNIATSSWSPETSVPIAVLGAYFGILDSAATGTYGLHDVAGYSGGNITTHYRGVYVPPAGIDVSCEALDRPNDGDWWVAGNLLPVQARFLNKGAAEETLWVHAWDNGAYHDSSQIILPVSGGATVSFSTWTRGTGPCTLWVYSALAGDLNTSNDTIMKVKGFTVTPGDSIVLDDGTMANAYYYYDADNVMANMFTPTQYPCEIDMGQVYPLSVGDPYWPWPDATQDEFRIGIWFDTDADGYPNEPPVWLEVVRSDTVVPSWVYAVPPCSTIVCTGGSFWIGMMGYVGGGEEGIGLDAATNFASNKWAREGGVWALQNYYTGDHMIRAQISYPTYNNDVGCDRIVAPTGMYEQGSITPSAWIKNYGVNAVGAFDVVFDVVGAGYSDTANVTGLASGDSVLLNWTPWAAVPGNYTAKCSTLLADDFPFNDKKEAAVAIVHYYEPFDATNGGFTELHDANQWEWGMPNYAFGPASAYTTPNCWGTNLTGDYTTDQNYRLTSINFVALQDNPTLFYYQWYDMEYYWDGGNVKYSTDGTNFNIIQGAGTHTPGYVTICYSGNAGVPSESVYTGAGTNWNLATFTVPVNNGDTFWLRWHFGSDYLIGYAGWYVDDVAGLGFVPWPLGNADMAVEAIVEPTGWNIPGDSVYPEATVHNYGDMTANYSATMILYDETDAEAYNQTLSGLTLDAGLSTNVVFPVFEITTNEGSWTSYCSVAVASDTFLGNNTLTGGFTVSTSPQWPAGWVEINSMPTGSQGKAVKRGGWLAEGPDVDGFEVIYAAKGYKTNEFYKYYIDGDSWGDVAGMPYETHPEWYKKAPRKGSKGCSDGADYIYVTQGNNSLGFWRLAMDGDSWKMLRDVPEGPYRKKVKGGTDMAYMVVNDTGYVYLLKGYKTEFYRYNTELDEWETLPEAPAGERAKWDKGSWLVAEAPDAEIIYAHKAKYHEMYTYYVDGDSWGPKIEGMPFVGSSGRRKKSKDGGSAAWYDEAIYALKGGNTQEWWRYTVVDSVWTELETMPSNGSTGKKKRVKYGADVVSYGMGYFFALKGNKTLEYWRYGLPIAPAMATLPQRSGVMAQPTGINGLGMTLAPNPLSGGFVTLRYTLPVAGPASINVVDVAGRTVERQTVYASRTGAVNLDLRNLSAGVYLVRFETDGFETTRKLVVQ